MDVSSSHRPVVVGIDGSKAALRAAKWAAAEAAARDVPVRLVHVVDPAGDVDPEEAMANARHVLHNVWEKLTATGLPVKLESDVRHGPPDIELAASAQDATMLCLGARRHKRAHGNGVAQRAVRLSAAPVAIVRNRLSREKDEPTRWIMVILDDSDESAPTLEAALEEARVWHAPIVAMTEWSTAHPRRGHPVEARLRILLEHAQQHGGARGSEPQICALDKPRDIRRLLNDSANTLLVVIAGSGDPDLVNLLTGPDVPEMLRHSRCSVLIARGPAAAV